MKGVLIIHPYSKTCLKINFDVLIEKTLWNRLRVNRIKKSIEKLKTGYLGGSDSCAYVRKFLKGRKKKYWYLYCEDLDHATPEINMMVVDDLISFNLDEVVVMEAL